jgi:acyl-coenzyme A synthetase/AMP-(fatty) acid ligase
VELADIGLACGATLLLFDGSPFYPDGNVLWEFTSKHKCTAVRHVGEIYRRAESERIEAQRKRMICPR